MNTELLVRALDSVLTDGKVIADLHRILSDGKEGDTTHVELNGRWVPVPTDVSVFVISKSFTSRRFNIGFGMYRVLVSLGPPVKEKSGGLESPYCFSTLYYNADVEMITLDFHTEMR